MECKRLSNQKLLSVIIPVYNVEKYIGECLESIITQSYQNIEIICVDDCSPDNSHTIIKQYAEKDDRIKYIKHNENLFQGGARNTGIKNAEGYYVTFIDSDDYLLHKDCYLQSIKLLEESNADISIFSFSELKNNKMDNYKLSSSILGVHNLNKDNFTKVHCSPCNKVFKLNDLKEKSIYFPEKIKFEDEAFWYKYVAALSPKAVVTNKYYYLYRIHSSSTMGNRNKYIYDYLDVALDILNYLDKINKKDYFQAHILNLLYSPAVSEVIYELNDEDVIKIGEKFKKILEKTGYDYNAINERVGACIYAYFINDKLIRENYLKTVDVLKPIKYKIIKPNKKIYKLKREVNRILNQIGIK